MMVRFEEDEYIAVAIFDAGNRVQTMEAMDEIFFISGRRYEAADFHDDSETLLS